MSKKQASQPSSDRGTTSSPPSPVVQCQKTHLVNSDSVNVEEQQSEKLQLVIAENKLLQDTLHQNNIALQEQFHNLTSWHEDVLKVHYSNMQHFEETSRALMDEINSLRNELITSCNKNKDLQKTIEQLKAALRTAQANATNATPPPGSHPVHVHAPLQDELDQERAKNKALEQRAAGLEAKWTSKKEDFLSIIGVMNRKLESCERVKASLEKEIIKISYQKRGLEKKVLSLQGPEKSLVCHSVDWNMDANLWALTTDFVETSPPITLCAGETVESLSNQLRDEKKMISRAKDLLVQHQDQLTKLITALNKPYSCRTTSDTFEANEVGETIETLFQKIQSLQEVLVSKDYEINQLKTRKTALENESDRMGILKSQVMVYRSDCLAERKTRETITNDRDRLLAELQIIKEENKQLRAHISAHGISSPSLTGTRLATRHERKIQTPPPHVPTTTVPIPPDVSPGISEPLVCPNPDCKQKFDSLEPLQYHVHQCLQLSD